MRERRNLKRNEINGLGLLHIDGVRGCYPCMVLNCHRDGAMLHSSTHHAAAPDFTFSLDGFERQGIAVCYGGTEILAVSDFPTKPLTPLPDPLCRTARHERWRVLDTPTMVGATTVRENSSRKAP